MAAERDAGYVLDSRLQDVLALIQVLGFGAEPAYTPRMICDAIQDVGEDRKPAEERLNHWEQVARGHPEFFRVSGKAPAISLVARFITGAESRSNTLDRDAVRMLMQTAIDIHDREARRSEKWTLYLPLVIAIIGAAGSFATAIVGLLAKG